MALTLAQASVLAPNTVQGGIVEAFVQTNPILDRLPIMPIDGGAYVYPKELALPGVEFRAVNAAYTESTGTFTTATETLVILGGDADVDRFLQATRSGIASSSARADQLGLKVKAISYKFSDAFFNGDTGVDANSFDGLKKRLAGAQVISFGTNGTNLVGTGTAAELNTTLDALDNLIAAAGVTPGNGAIYCNDLIGAKLASVIRRFTSATFTEETLGAVTKPVLQYRGIPVLDPGNNLAGTRILPQTETQGSSSLASSIYAVRFGQNEGDGAVTGLANTNHVPPDQMAEGIFAVHDLGQQDAKPVLRHRIEGYLGVAVFGTGAARLTGVLNG